MNKKRTFFLLLGTAQNLPRKMQRTGAAAPKRPMPGQACISKAFIMSIFKAFPLIGVVMDRLMDFIGFYMGLKIHRMSQVIHSVQYLCNHRSVPCELIRWKCGPGFSTFHNTKPLNI